MTIVARLSVNNFPLLIGDILLSAPEVPGLSITVPTIGDITSVFPEGSGFTPSGLRQKIAIVSDDLVIGWSGNRIAAQVVIRELIEKNHVEPFTYDSLMHHFESLDESIWEQGLGLVGFITEARGTAPFGFWYHDLPTNLFRHVGLLGTGVEHFAEQLQGSSFPMPSREVNDLERALAYGLTLSGVFLSAEIATYATLLNFFGGGYEIASLSEGKFQKLDDITYLFWQGKASDDGMNVKLNQVCKYSYVRDVLLIRTATPSKIPKEARLTINQKLEVVPPIYKNVTREEFMSVPPPSFNSTWICNYFLMPHPQRGVAVFVAVHYRGVKKARIQFIEKENHLIIGFEDTWLEGIIKQAYNSFV